MASDSSSTSHTGLPWMTSERSEQKTSVITQVPERIQLSDDPDEFHPIPSNLQPQQIGHYCVLETIGQGGFGIVVKAFDQKLQRIVAIKMMTSELAATSPARRRFVREARAGAAVRHDNVVRIYAVEEQPVPYLVMEYVPGRSLQQYLDLTGPLDPKEVLRIGAQIARGLAAAHVTGLVHRDVKPGNVLLEEGEGLQVKLTDFGLARAADDASLTQSGMVAGTPMYMAPEQARGEAFDHRADLFSLGSVLYVMVTGRPPYRASNPLAVMKRVAEENPRPIQEIIPETPDWLCSIINKLQGRNPDDRYQTAAEVAAILEKCALGLQQGHSIIAVESTQKQAHRPIWRTALLSGAATLACVGIFLLFVLPPLIDRTEAVPKQGAVTAIPPKPSTEFTNAIGMEFVKVPAGHSQLGGRDGNPGARKVHLEYDFYIGKYEVTREEWEKIMGPGTVRSIYSRTGSKNIMVAGLSDEDLRRFPVDSVNWWECQEFIKRLNSQSHDSGWFYRLPTYTEWEYACRNGPGQSEKDLGCNYYANEPSVMFNPNHANLVEGGLNRPAKVGTYPPNRLGIHDMHGNAVEWLDVAPDDAPHRRGLIGGFWNDPKELGVAWNLVTALPEQANGCAGLRLVRVPFERATTARALRERVIAELSRMNPEYKGQHSYVTVDDRVTEMTLLEAHTIRDLTPLRELRHLEYLRAMACNASDLSPLSNLPLRRLFVDNDANITDLRPLKGLPLEELGIWGFAGDDFTPLSGMKLRHLNCGANGLKTDLKQLQGLPLDFLMLNYRDVRDLSPLTGMTTLEQLYINFTPVTDLTPLKGLKLKRFDCVGTKIKDFSPLAGMPLESVDFSGVPNPDIDVFRNMPTLKEINLMPAAMFWEKHDE